MDASVTGGPTVGGRRALRPTAYGAHAAATSGHPLATLAAIEVLKTGGNAIDAGVAAALVASVLQSDMVSVGGIACIQVHHARSGDSTTFAGVGAWPELARVEYFVEECNGHVPFDARNAIVPGAPDAYISALEQFGTWSFSKVAERAIALAFDGFPMFPFRHLHQSEHASEIAAAPSTRELFWPDGRQPAVGEVFRQPALGRSLQMLQVASDGLERRAGLRAAREVFYRGEIAERIDRQHRDLGAFLRSSDLAAHTTEVALAERGTWHGYDVRTCSFWSKGPLLIHILNLLEDDDLRVLGHNSAAYIHLIAEATKLAYADRHAYFGDPRLVEVPRAGILSKDYARQRRALISARTAWPGMPPAGDPWYGGRAAAPIAPVTPSRLGGSHADTSNLSVVDGEGNAFNVTFSDPFTMAPLTADLGFLVSGRGIQSFAIPGHPNAVRAGQRPVVTGNPAMIFRDGKLRLTVGSPGLDVQLQAMVQVILNTLVFDMDIQQAIEAPRFATYSHPSSFEPHTAEPGVLRIESRIDPRIRAQLSEMGHRIEPWPEWQWQAGGVCAIARDSTTGVLSAGADPRRECEAMAF